MYMPFHFDAQTHHTPRRVLGVIPVSHLHSLTAGLADQTCDQNFVGCRNYNPYDNVSFEGASRVDEEIKHFRRELPSMGPCLRCYCFYSHEEENKGHVTEVWLLEVIRHKAEVS